MPMSDPDVGDLRLARGRRGLASARCRYRAGGSSRVARAAAGWQGATPAAPGADEAAGPILAGWTMIEVFDTTAARIALGRRMLGCPACDQPLRPWGHARERTVRDLDGALLTMCPDRALCTGCGATHVVLDAGLLPRRAYTALEEQRSEKYRHALIAVVGIGVRAGQTGRDRCLARVPPGISRMNTSAVIHLVTCRNSR